MNIKIKSFIFNPFGVNTFIVYNENKALIIDPACYNDKEKDTIVQFLNEKKLTPEKLLCTHGHVDHIFGNNFLKHKYDIAIFAHPEDDFLIEQAVSFANMFGLETEKQPLPDRHLTDGDRLEFAGIDFQVLHIPGHSPGGIAFYARQIESVFAGDVLFKTSIGRTDLPRGNMNVLLENIKQKLFTLPDNTVVYPGHGETTTIKFEKNTNPFFKT